MACSHTLIKNHDKSDCREHTQFPIDIVDDKQMSTASTDDEDGDTASNPRPNTQYIRFTLICV